MRNRSPLFDQSDSSIQKSRALKKMYSGIGGGGAIRDLRTKFQEGSFAILYVFFCTIKPLDIGWGRGQFSQ